MTDHDQNLITDFIDGRLSSDEVAAVEARLETDTAFADTFAEQMSGASVLGDAPPPTLTTEERSDMRASLIRSLNLEAGVAVAAVPVKQPRRWWKPAFGVAAVAAVVAVVVVLPGSMSSDDSAEVAFSEPSATLTATDSAADGASTEESGDLLAAQEPVSVVDLEGADIDELLDATVEKNQAGEVEDSLRDLGYQGEALIDGNRLADCVSSLASQLPPQTSNIILFGVDTSGPTNIAHIGLDFGDGIAAALSVDLSDCSLVALDN